MTLLVERVNEKELIEQLEQIPLGRMYLAGYKALMRLQIYFTGRTHEILLEFGDRARGAVLRAAGKEQMLNGSSALELQSEMWRLWGDAWSTWSAEFQQIRRESGRIAFGVAAMFHDRLLVQKMTGLKESQIPIQEQAAEGVFEPQLRTLIDVSEQYIYGDGLTLSGRIWQIDREARDGINAVILNGVQNGDSAWNIAKDLELFLGAGEDCPRWTSTRLYGRTKKEIAAGDLTGLVRGDECDGSGVSYNALRLARTEIQKIHSLATDRMLALQPWVEQEQIHLSPAHAETDICDEVVQGGQNGEGIYPVGEIELPLHPNDLCYKTAVLMGEKEFTSNLSGWMNDTKAWPEMDEYSNNLVVPVESSMAPSAISLAVWMFSDKLQEWMQ